MAKVIITPEKRKWVRLTRVCNNRCLFCLDSDSLDGKYETPAAVRAELEAGRGEGCRRVVLSGGEPTLHPEFIKIVGLARELGYTHIQAITNGRLLCYREFFAQAVKAGLSEITFSVHGATSAQHDLLVGVPGAFAQTLLAISNAMKIPGLIVSSDIVVNRVNADSLFEIVALLHKLGINEYDLLNLVPFGSAWKNWKKLSYDPEQKREVFRRVFRFVEANRGHVWTNRFPLRVLEGNERYIQHPDKLLDEVRGMRQVLNEYLATGKAPFCRGPRCAACVLRQFCGDLEQLRAKGFLASVPPPKCLPGKARPGRRVRLGADALEVGAFYVKERMTVKGSACAGCAENKRCRGAAVLAVMSRGFAALTPRGKR